VDGKREKETHCTDTEVSQFRTVFWHAKCTAEISSEAQRDWVSDKRPAGSTVVLCICNENRDIVYVGEDIQSRPR